MDYELKGMSLSGACRVFEVEDNINSLVEELFGEDPQYIVDNLVWLEDANADIARVIDRLMAMDRSDWLMGSNYDESVPFFLEHGVSPAELVDRIKYNVEEEGEADALVFNPTLLKYAITQNDVFLGELLAEMAAWDSLTYEHLAHISNAAKDDSRLFQCMVEHLEGMIVQYIPWFVKNTKTEINLDDLFSKLFDWDHYQTENTLLELVEIKGKYDLPADLTGLAEQLAENHLGLIFMYNIDLLVSNGVEFNDPTKFAIQLIEDDDFRYVTNEMVGKSIFLDYGNDVLTWFFEQGADPTAIAVRLIECGMKDKVIEDLSKFVDAGIDTGEFAVSMAKNQYTAALMENIHTIVNNHDELFHLAIRLINECGADIVLENIFAFGKDGRMLTALTKHIIRKPHSLDVLDEKLDKVLDRGANATILANCLIEAHEPSLVATHLDEFLCYEAKIDFKALISELVVVSDLAILEEKIPTFLRNTADPTNLAILLLELGQKWIIRSYLDEFIDAGVDECLLMKN